MTDAANKRETEDDDATGCTCPKACAMHPDDDDDDGVTQADLAALERAAREDAAELRAELTRVREEARAALRQAPVAVVQPQRGGARALVLTGIILGALLALAAIARAVSASSRRYVA